MDDLVQRLNSRIAHDIRDHMEALLIDARDRIVALEAELAEVRRIMSTPEAVLAQTDTSQDRGCEAVPFSLQRHDVVCVGLHSCEVAKYLPFQRHDAIRIDSRPIYVKFRDDFSYSPDDWVLDEQAIEALNALVALAAGSTDSSST